MPDQRNKWVLGTWQRAAECESMALHLVPSERQAVELQE